MDGEATHLTHRVTFVKGRNQRVKLLNRECKARCLLLHHEKTDTNHASGISNAPGQRFDKFDPNKQTWKLFLNQIRGFVITMGFLVLFVVTMVIYERNKTADRRGRLVFNTLLTAIILSLGLNFFEVFKDMAKVVRWRILSRNEMEIRQIDLVLGAESLLKVFQLILENLAKPLILVVCAAWLLLNIIAQVSVAILPLFASLESGFSSNGTTVAPGDVHIPRLDCFYKAGSNSCSTFQEEYDPAIAHTYGEAGILRGQDCGYNTTDDIISGGQECPYFYRNDRKEFAMRYAELNPLDKTSAYPYFGAGRIVTASASNCNGYNVTGKTPGTTSDTDGTDNVFVWPFVNATAHTKIEIPKANSAFSSTTYIWNDTALPRHAGAQACGPRCVYMYALRDLFGPNNGPHELFMFQCQITVSPVSSVTNPLHNLDDGVARTAAASIALSGRWRSPPEGRDWRQYQLYQQGADWAAELDDSPDEIGARMAEFTIAGLGSMARRNPPVTVPGQRPTLGYQLNIDWKWVIVIAACIAASHALLVALMLWLARPVIVGDDSYLVVARLLRGLVASLPEGKEEDLLDGKKIAREIAASVGAQASVDEGEELRALLGSGVAEDRQPLVKYAQAESERPHVSPANSGSDVGGASLAGRTVHAV